MISSTEILFVKIGLRASLVGVQERTMIYGYLLWVVVLAIVLLRAEKGLGSINGSDA